MKSFQATISSPLRSLFQGEVGLVTLPTTQGSIQILANHMSILVQLLPGEVLVKTDAGESQALYVSGGFAYVNDGNLFVLPDYGEDLSQMSLEDLQKAQEKATHMKEAFKDDNLMRTFYDGQLSRILATGSVLRKWSGKARRN